MSSATSSATTLFQISTALLIVYLALQFVVSFFQQFFSKSGRRKEVKWDIKNSMEILDGKKTVTGCLDLALKAEIDIGTMSEKATVTPTQIINALHKEYYTFVTFLNGFCVDVAWGQRRGGNGIYTLVSGAGTETMIVDGFGQIVRPNPKDHSKYSKGRMYHVEPQDSEAKLKKFKAVITGTFNNSAPVMLAWAVLMVAIAYADQNAFTFKMSQNVLIGSK